ncbi:RNA polymerase sigma-70 factor [Pedobacter frigidisoli]|uniref:RNA polymerase sigma-70 factor n=1 Tax=Pedobacter frigidisoli TaxID=2530455 RepID=UPI00292CEA9B|nr:RNA polymerase sigma-70 factor [Pedobacter frigidisoli]
MDYGETSDIMLLSALKAGDRAAFEEIYHQNWERMYKYAFYILKDQDQCTDIVQEIFVKMWVNRDALVVRSFRAYLISAVKYKIANNIRHEKIRADFFSSAPTNDVSYNLADNELEIRELKNLIESAVGQLPPKCREIFLLSRNEYLSNKEIAVKLKISEKTVEGQMTIALKRLRKALGDLYMLCWLI